MSILSRLEKTFKEVERLHTVPINDRANLEDRLVITCKTYDRLPREATPRPASETRKHHHQKKAQRVYSEILTYEPHFYLPFILTISPKACLSVDVGKIRKYSNTLGRISLDHDAESIFKTIATKNGIDQSHYYKRVILVLFGGLTFLLRPIFNDLTNMNSSYDSCGCT
jgi:hypothetical protein